MRGSPTFARAAGTSSGWQPSTAAGHEVSLRPVDTFTPAEVKLRNTIVKNSFCHNRSEGSRCQRMIFNLFHQFPSIPRPSQPPSSHRAESDQHEFRPWPRGGRQGPVEYELRPGRSRPPLQGELELDHCRTTLCFISDQKEEDREGGEDRNKRLRFKPFNVSRAGAEPWMGLDYRFFSFLNHTSFYVHLIGLVQFLSPACPKSGAMTSTCETKLLSKGIKI